MNNECLKVDSLLSTFLCNFFGITSTEVVVDRNCRWPYNDYRPKLSIEVTG